MSEAPTIGKIFRHKGVAGQYTLTAEVSYPGEDGNTVFAKFVGNVSGGPIVAIMPSGQQVFVSREVMERIGSKLTPEWIRRYFA